MAFLFPRNYKGNINFIFLWAFVTSWHKPILKDHRKNSFFSRNRPYLKAAAMQPHNLTRKA